MSDIRREFEDKFKHYDLSKTSDGECYLKNNTAVAWFSWQARAELDQSNTLALESRVKELTEALTIIRNTLHEENDNENGAIQDTIWYSSTETLFDFIDEALSITTPTPNLDKHDAEVRDKAIEECALLAKSMHCGWVTAEVHDAILKLKHSKE